MMNLGCEGRKCKRGGGGWLTDRVLPLALHAGFNAELLHENNVVEEVTSAVEDLMEGGE